MRKILIVAPSWVGDAVLTQPLLKRLHAIHSPVALEVLAPTWTSPVFARMREVTTIHIASFGHGEIGLTKRRTLARALALQGYDQAIVLPNSFKSALVPWFARIPLRTGFVGELRGFLLNDPRRLDRNALPQMVERFALLAEAAGRPLHRPLSHPDLSIDTAQRAATLAKFGLDMQRPVAAFCPGAEYGPAKRWPAQHFAALAGKFSAQGYAIWLIGSKNDQAAAEEILRLCNKDCIHLCGRTTLDEAIDLLSVATVVVSNDSGLMHVAAALARPLIALYGSSSPRFTPPLSELARVLTLDLECSPCFQRECPLGHFNCMMKLTPERVWQQIDFAKIPTP